MLAPPLFAASYYACEDQRCDACEFYNKCRGCDDGFYLVREQNVPTGACGGLWLRGVWVRRKWSSREA